MSWGSSIDVRQVIFVNKLAEESYENLPEPVREAADNAIALIQNNRPLPPKRVDK
jgi:predicted Zn-dependent protease with MMP-like domain